MENVSKYITLREAGKLSGYSSDYLSFLIREGRLKGQKVGKSWMTTQENLNEFLGHAGVSPKKRLPYALRLMFFACGISMLVALVVAAVYYSVYETGYQQAQAGSSPSEVTTQLDNTPLTY